LLIDEVLEEGLIIKLPFFFELLLWASFFLLNHLMEEMEEEIVNFLSIVLEFAILPFPPF